MRVALIVIAALLALGLSAPGFVATQRAPNASISPTLSKDNSAEAPVRSAPAAPIPGQLPSNQNSRLPSSPVGPPTAGVLTFDDGPWPQNTPAALKALADECLKATFFEIGVHAVWHPEITKQVIEAGTTVGAHTWSHKDLARNPYAKDIELAEQEIEMGNTDDAAISASKHYSSERLVGTTELCTDGVARRPAAAVATSSPRSSRRLRQISVTVSSYFFR